MKDYKDYFIKHGFMMDYEFHQASIADFLFRLSRDGGTVKRLDFYFDDFLTQHGEEILEDETGSIDFILMITNIDSICEFMKKKFLAHVALDNTLMTENARDYLISILTEPERFFSLYRGSK